MNIVSVTDFRNNISDYLNRLTYNNESFFIKKGKLVVAKIIKADYPNKKPSIMDLAGLLTSSEADKMKKLIKKVRSLDNDPLRHFRSN